MNLPQDKLAAPKRSTLCWSAGEGPVSKAYVCESDSPEPTEKARHTEHTCDPSTENMGTGKSYRIDALWVQQEALSQNLWWKGIENIDL